MAILIPTVGTARFDARGELRLAERLRDCLEENAWVWHNVPLGDFGRRPDFLVLHPGNGALVLEVKDWRLDAIARADVNTFELIVPGGNKRVENPIGQARGYMFALKQTIERDASLVFPAGHPRAGASIVALGRGVVFTRITRRSFEQTDLGVVLPPAACLFSDEMREGVDPEEFRARLWAMVRPRQREALSMPQVDRLRAHIYPEVVIRQVALPFDEEPAEGQGDRVLAVMDLHQEILARSLGEGHRIVRGVAGSGKTLILAFRAEHLARALPRPILILCYGNGIAGRLRQSMQVRGVLDRVQVFTFHGWCYQMLRAYGIPFPGEEEFPELSARLEEVFRRVVVALDGGHIPAGQYDAILIDEAHDFEADWLRLAVRMVSGTTRSLLVVYDDAQAIFRGRKRPIWSEVGIEARGRTTVLRVNYRNTAEILAFARRFAADLLDAPGWCADDEDPTLRPEQGGRHGPEPMVRECRSHQDESEKIAEWLRERHRAGHRWAHLAVLYPRHWIGGCIAETLRRSGFPIDIAKEHQNRIDASQDAVRLLSIHNAKGLEFACVAIGGLGSLGRGPELQDDIRLTYVGVTRATHELLLTYSDRSELVRRLC